MKKPICILLAILMSASVLSGCGKTAKSSKEDASAATEVQEDVPAYEVTYGGMTVRDAVLAALGFVGAGYQCVSYERLFLRNNEAWYLGLQASDGSDENVYYVYVNTNSCAPVGEIPNIGGENRADSGVFKADYAGISEQDAIFKALAAAEGGRCVSSEKSEHDGKECWLIGVEGTDGAVIGFYVNADSCTPKV